MFAYLNKKVEIPNKIRLHCISWNSEQGWISCGGDNGLLKVLKLEPDNPQGGGRGLSYNQSVAGHKAAVTRVAWNEHFRKLTTSDSTGLIMVWVYVNGRWFEEMINNRGKNAVADLKWTSDGKQICIGYEDGAVILGSVDGKRLWGIELPYRLKCVAWSPDSKVLLLVSQNGDVNAHDEKSNFLKKVALPAIDDVPGTKIAAVDWYDGAEGWADLNAPTLAIGFVNGRIQLMRNESDDQPVLIDTEMELIEVKWNTSGTVLACSGRTWSQVAPTAPGAIPGESRRPNNMIQFYGPLGQHYRTLSLPQPTPNPYAISWEGGGQRLAIAMDACIYFASVKMEFKWGFFDGVVVYAFTRPDQSKHFCQFWDTKTDEKVLKQVQNVQLLTAAAQNCCLVTRLDDGSGQFILILCNAIGSPVDTKYIDFEPQFACMSGTHVVVSSGSLVYVWNYRSNVPSADQAALPSTRTAGGGKETEFFIDDQAIAEDREHFRRPEVPTTNPICALTCSDMGLYIARESGVIHRYSLPRVQLETKYDVRCRPHHLYLNSNSTRLAIIDVRGILNLWDVDTQNPQAQPGESPIGVRLEFERKECWDLRWSEDYPNIFAVMEKGRMYIFRGLAPEEPIPSTGYICSFQDLEVKAVLLDEIMAEPDYPDKAKILNFETKSLRDTRQLVKTVDIQEAYQFIEANPHPRLWNMLAEVALERLDFTLADKAFVLCRDYHGIQFVKKLKLLSDPAKQRAEVMIYFKKFEVAERMYREMDRVDLAIALRIKLGDWARVTTLVQGGAGDDEMLMRAYNEIGEYYADRQKWSKAVKYFQQAKNFTRLAQCYYVLEQYAELEGLMQSISEGTPLLKEIGQMFASVGIPEQAIAAFLKGGEPQLAIDACVHLNQWDQAVSLAERYHVLQIEELLTKYATHLLEKKNTVQAIELYRKAHRHVDAARLLAELGLEVGKQGNNPLRAKKLCLLAGLEIEQHRRRLLGAQPAGDVSEAKDALDQMLSDDIATTTSDKKLDLVWRGAEAYHFLLLAQKQLYSGDHEAALRTALRLAEYDDMIEPRTVYSLIALTAFHNKQYAQCSRAFIKLEGLEGTPNAKREAYEELALSIFTRHPPKDSSESRTYPCPTCQNPIADWATSCLNCNTSFQACIASGRSLLERERGRGIYMCKVCKHRAYEVEMQSNCCPLCHSPLS